MWDLNGQELEVAMYVRTVRDAERLKGSVASRTLVRQQQEALGLSLPGLARLKWLIDADPANVVRQRVPARSDVRARLKVVASG